MSKRLFSTRRWLGVLAMATIMPIMATTAQAQVFRQIPSPPELSLTSYILIDATSGEVLAEKNPDETLHPASLTKMMTTYLTEAELHAGNISRDDKVLISEKAWSLGGSTMFIEVGERVPVGELLKGVIIVSGNDASVALAEHIAGSESAFAQLMNSTAQQIGMNNSKFQNASGWPAEDHYSTARDLATLSKHIVQDFPEYYDIHSEKYYQYGVDKKTGKPLRRQANRNRLLWTNPSVDGLKTGHIEATGYHLAVTSARDGRRLIAVLLGAKSEKQRADDAQKLLTYGFRFFENVDVKKGGQPLQTVEVWKGDISEISVGIAEDLIVTVPRGSSKDLAATLTINPTLEAPIEQEQAVGSVKVMLDDELVTEVPLIAQQSVEKGGFFKRLWDSIVLFFTGLLA
ncbi:D-alanyl-D-alanine carboxypeptidase family protein [uncultured Endozoicomonas sp.]|uniref:D-alanyl-D-alanine carboxypeptidase family protein n=1 Tax=uncultured Endozoicomonas sp. TaxID=432652 RepID=UPI0026369BC7|nr:D-alanyl-D-alanine carboxypeptidase family protein [uncultured Endozoicomonas sp.]